MDTLYEAYVDAIGGNLANPQQALCPKQVAEIFAAYNSSISEEQLLIVWNEEVSGEGHGPTWPELQKLAAKCDIDCSMKDLPVPSTLSATEAAKNDTQDGESAENESESSTEPLADRVAFRWSNAEFPYIRTCELSSIDAEEEAKIILQLASRTDVAKHNAYIEHEYKKECNGSVSWAALSETQRRFAFAVDFYYMHVHTHLCSIAFETRVSHITSMTEPLSL